MNLLSFRFSVSLTYCILLNKVKKCDLTYLQYFKVHFFFSLSTAIDFGNSPHFPAAAASPLLVKSANLTIT